MGLERGMQVLLSSQINIDSKGQILSVRTEEITANKYSVSSFVYEVNRVVNLMPDWIPAELNKKKCDTTAKLIIYFTLNLPDSRYNSPGDTVFINAYSVPITGLNDSIAYQTELRIRRREMANKLYETGIEFSNDKNYEKALEYFNMAMKHDDSSKKELMYQRGNAFFNLKQSDKACQDWLEAYRFNYSYAADAFEKNCRSKKKK